MLHLVIFLIIFYSSIVVGTYKKFKINGIYFTPKSYPLLSVFPLILFFTHLSLAIDSLFEKKYKSSLESIKLCTIDYPVMLGLFIEATLERKASKLTCLN